MAYFVHVLTSVLLIRISVTLHVYVFCATPSVSVDADLQ